MKDLILRISTLLAVSTILFLSISCQSTVDINSIELSDEIKTVLNRNSPEVTVTINRAELFASINYILPLENGAIVIDDVYPDGKVKPYLFITYKNHIPTSFKFQNGPLRENINASNGLLLKSGVFEYAHEEGKISSGTNTGNNENYKYTLEGNCLSEILIPKTDFTLTKVSCTDKDGNISRTEVITNDRHTTNTYSRSEGYITNKVMTETKAGVTTNRNWDYTYENGLLISSILNKNNGEFVLETDHMYDVESVNPITIVKYNMQRGSKKKEKSVTITLNENKQISKVSFQHNPEYYKRYTYQ